MGVAFSLQLLDSASDWNGVEMGGGGKLFYHCHSLVLIIIIKYNLQNE